MAFKHDLETVNDSSPYNSVGSQNVRVRFLARRLYWPWKMIQDGWSLVCALIMTLKITGHFSC